MRTVMSTTASEGTSNIIFALRGIYRFSHCYRDKQKKFQAAEKERIAREALEVKPEEKEVEEVLHEDNEWGISLEDESTPVTSSNQANQLVEGVQVRYEIFSSPSP